MIKLINIITQNIILLGCCAISIFILFVLITFIKNVDDFAAIECTFAWDCTKEGYDFWKGFNDKYKSIWEMSDSGALLLLSNYQYTYQYY